MTRRRQTTQLVPVEPAHRRTWKSLWRRCSCGLPTPCVDRLLPPTPLPFPPRAPARRPALTALPPRGRAALTSLLPSRPSPGAPHPRQSSASQPSIPLPQRRRPSPPPPIPGQQRRTTKDRQPLPLRDSAPGGSRAQSAGSGETSVSLSQRSPGGDGAPMRSPSPPDGYLPRQRGRPSNKSSVASPSQGDTRDGDGRIVHRLRGGRILNQLRSGRVVHQVNERPWKASGRPVMAYRQINLRHW